MLEAPRPALVTCFANILRAGGEEGSALLAEPRGHRRA